MSLLALAMLCVLNKLVEDLRKSSDTVHWPTVQGSVLSSQVVRGCGKNGAYYYPRLRYQYPVGSNSYTGQRIGYVDDDCGAIRAARQVAERYAAGGSVAVHYNPAQPSESVLVPGTLGKTWLLIIVMGVLELCCLGGLLGFVQAWPGKAVAAG